MELNWLNIIIGLFLTLISYMIVPFILKCKNGVYSKENAKKLSLYNSIIISFIYLILSIVINGSSSPQFWSPAPAMLYYGVNCYFLSHSKAKYSKNRDKKSIEKKNMEKQQFRFNYKNLSLFLGIIVIVLIGGCLYLNFLYRKTFQLYTEYKVNDLLEENDAKKELDSLNGERTTSWTQEKLEFFDENIVFVIDGYGNYYYNYDCMIDNIEGEYQFWAYNKEQAIFKGYTKSTCN